MAAGKNGLDPRVRERRVSPTVLIGTFVALAIWTTVQMKILGDYIHYEDISRAHFIAIVVFWLLSAAAFMFMTTYQINHRYEKPMRQFAKATRQVADGDFSVYVKPLHTAEKMDYLDAMFLDFNRMVEELGSIETLKTDFFSNVSHEFKTPLSVIQSYAQMLAQEGVSEEQRLEYANSILQSSRRLSALITNLLKLSRLEKQTICPKPEPYDLCRQLCECALGFEGEWEQKGLTFIADIEDSAKIVTDETLLELVWNNLLSNAIKFTEPGGTVTLRQTSCEDSVTVSVTDTGCGMSQNTLKHIFDKFYQGDTSHSTEGNGLGLPLALRVLQLCGCSVTADSKVGSGSAFTVTIPAEQGEQNE